ncbi:MAG TPA: hypothetical protein ENG62_02575 [Thermoplasmatales archaeon]|nr:hypothetical protein [Thermoplasmatales archaeon]
MWLVTTFIAAFIVTTLWYLLPKRYNLEFLSFMLWGATLMILVDHILGYEGGEFLEIETDGLISSGALLGIVMLLPVIIIWGVSLIISGNKVHN